MDTARRSLRAFRTSQPQSISDQTTILSSRADRATRSTIKLDSPEKLNSLTILKSEENIYPSEEISTMQTRRKRGRTEEQRDKPLRIQASQVHNTSRLDQVGEDDEVVRCICGLDDYPGLPKSEGEINLEVHKLIEGPLNSVLDVAEDVAGFFLQCDVCKVWQHGGCVGIENEGSSPEEYFCERCRKDLHKIFTATNGQRYSHYLPLHQSLSCSTPCSGLIMPKEEAQSPKSNKTSRPQSLHHANAKRRSTMNSRDAAYDEEEQIRRAIAASRDVRTVENVDGCMKRGKRGRSESEEKLQGSKRRRTKSASSSSSQEFNQISPQQESDDGGNGRTTSCKKTRSSGSKTPKEKDLKDEREKSRCDAIAKRNGRAERRRVDDQETQKEAPLSSRNLVGHGIDSSNTSTLIESLEPSAISNGKFSDNPPINQPPPSSKKSNRNLNSRKGKLVKNHFTRERDQHVHDDQHSYRSQSRDTLRTDDASQTYSNRGFSGEPRTGKFKGNPSKVTMNDMKRRISAILDFISRTQLEMASESSYYATDDSIRNTAQEQTNALQPSQAECDQESPCNVINQATETSHSPKEFKDLSCRDMMDVLTKQLIKWQKDFLH